MTMNVPPPAAVPDVRYTITETNAHIGFAWRHGDILYWLTYDRAAQRYMYGIGDVMCSFDVRIPETRIYDYVKENIIESGVWATFWKHDMRLRGQKIDEEMMAP